MIILHEKQLLQRNKKEKITSLELRRHFIELFVEELNSVLPFCPRDIVAAGNLGISIGHMSTKQSARAGCVVHHSRRYWQKRCRIQSTTIISKEIFFNNYRYSGEKDIHEQFSLYWRERRKPTPPTGLEPAIFGLLQVLTWHSDRRPTPYPLGHGGELASSGGKKDTVLKANKNKNENHTITTLGY